jgi:hypothetical protein
MLRRSAEALAKAEAHEAHEDLVYMLLRFASLVVFAIIATIARDRGFC